MGKDLKLQVLFDAVDKITGPLKNISKSSTHAAESLKKTRDALKGFDGAQKNIAQFRKLKQSLGTTSEALKQAQQRVKTLADEAKKSGGSVKGLNAQLKKAKDAAGKLKEKFKSQTQSLQKTRTALKNAGVSTKNLSNASRTLKTKIASTTSALNKQKKALEGVRKRQIAVNKIKGNYKRGQQHQANLSFVGAAGVGVGMGAKRAGQSFFNPALEFNQAMSTVQARANLKKQSPKMQALRTQSKQLGANTSFTGTEVAMGQAFLAQANFNPKQIQQAMPSMVDLAKAGGLDLPSTADIASNIMGAFKLTADQSQMVADTLAATTTSSNVDLTMLGETMKGVAPIAAKAGASLQTVAAMTGLLGNIGIQGSQADTALKNMFARMAAPPPDAQKSFKALGIATKDTQGNLKQMPQILKEVADKTKNMGTADQLKHFKAITGLRAMAGASELVSQAQSGDLQGYIKKLENVNGRAEQIRKVMEDNAMGDLEKTKSAWQGLATTMLEGNNTAFRTSIQSISQLINQISTWVQKNPELAATILKITAGITALATAGGVLALTIAGIAGPLNMVIKTLRIMSLAVMANPIILIIAAIAGVAYLIYKNWAGIKTFFAEIWNSVSDKFWTFKENLYLDFMNAWIKIKAGVQEKWLSLVMWWGAKKAEWLQTFENLKTKFLNFGKSIVDGLLTGINAKWQTIKNKIKSLGAMLPNWLQKKLGIQSPSKVFAQIGVHSMDGLAQGLGREAKAPLAQVVSLADKLKKQGRNITFAAGMGLASLPAAAGTPQSAPPPVINITINAAPGMNEQQLAEQVASQVAKALARPQANTSGLYDED